MYQRVEREPLPRGLCLPGVEREHDRDDDRHERPHHVPITATHRNRACAHGLADPGVGRRLAEALGRREQAGAHRSASSLRDVRAAQVVEHRHDQQHEHDHHQRGARVHQRALRSNSTMRLPNIAVLRVLESRVCVK